MCPNVAALASTALAADTPLGESEEVPAAEAPEVAVVAPALAQELERQAAWAGVARL